MTDTQHWESMYERSPEELPWEITEPPLELIEVIEKGMVTPCKTLDIGCGTGNYAIYLAKKGFDVTGVDFSEKALLIAKQRAIQIGVKIEFVKSDAMKLTQNLHQKFGFILDYSLLHHIPLEKIGEYAQQFKKLLQKGGKLLIVCYSEEDEDVKGQKTSVGKYGNIMHYHTADEIREAYQGLEEIYYKKARLGKRLHHAGHCFLFENETR